MPNHCYNRVTISAHEGKEDQFKKLVKIFESDKKVYWVLQNPDMYKTNNSSGYSLNTGCGGWDYT